MLQVPECIHTLDEIREPRENVWILRDKCGSRVRPDDVLNSRLSAIDHTESVNVFSLCDGGKRFIMHVMVDKYYY